MRVKRLRLRVWGLGLTVEGLGLRAEGGGAKTHKEVHVRETPAVDVVAQLRASPGDAVVGLRTEGTVPPPALTLGNHGNGHSHHQKCIQHHRAGSSEAHQIYSTTA